jgi:hypothetical protein
MAIDIMSLLSVSVRLNRLAAQTTYFFSASFSEGEGASRPEMAPIALLPITTKSGGISLPMTESAMPKVSEIIIEPAKLPTIRR